MTSGQKVTLSLLLSILVFSAFSVIAFSGLFNLVEVKFYQPFVEQIKEKKADEIVLAQKEYFETLMNKFNIFAMDSNVKTYCELRPNDSSVQSREKLRSELFTSTSALNGIRIIDENAQNVYFSTFASDSIQNTNSFAYKNYENLDELPYEFVRSSDWISENFGADEKCRIVKDSLHNRLIFSYPFFDESGSYKGTILFYCDAGNLSRFLYNKNLIDVNGFGLLISESDSSDFGFGGFVFGLPNYGRSDSEKQILKKWKESPDENFWKIIPDTASLSLSSENGEDDNVQPFCVFSRKTAREDFGFIALIFKESEIKLSVQLRILLLAVFFITFYLIVFLVLSFRHDDIVVIKDRIKKYKNEFLAEYKKIEDSKNVEKLSDLKTHKKTLENQIKLSLGKIGKKHQEEVDELFEKAWAEILLAIRKDASPLLGENLVVSKNDLRTILEDILGSGTLTVKTVPSMQELPPSTHAGAETSQVSDSLEERKEGVESDVREDESSVAVEDVSDADEVIEEVEDAEELDEAEAIDEAEELEDKDEAVEEIDEPEEISEAEDVSDADEVIEEVEDAEELDEAEAIDEAVEEISEADEVIEELEDTEELDEAEAIDEAEELEDAEDVSDADEVIEEIEDTEELDEAEAIDESEEISDDDEVTEEISDDDELTEEIEDAEELDEAEAIDEAEELDEDAESGDTHLSPDDFVPGITANNLDSSDEVFADDFLLEKIDFGVPPEQNNDIELEDDPSIDNFEISEPDFKYIDYDESFENEANDYPREFDEKDALKKDARSDNGVGEDILSENTSVSAVSEEAAATQNETNSSQMEESPSEKDSKTENEDIQELEEVSEIENLEKPEENMPFSFTNLAYENCAVKELESDIPDTIIENSDGTFSIADADTSISDQDIDLDFKKLVDSILR